MRNSILLALKLLEIIMIEEEFSKKDSYLEEKKNGYLV